jgi:hypothetical protein
VPGARSKRPVAQQAATTLDVWRRQGATDAHISAVLEATGCIEAPATRGPTSRRAVPEDVLEVLKSCTVTSNVVRIQGQLDRPIYEAVNRILEGIGGKWNRKAKGHTFELGDAEDLLDGVIRTGDVRDIRKELQFFPTPVDVADRMVRWASICASHSVLEPSAGRGDLAKRIRQVTENVTVLELHEPFRNELRASGLFTVLDEADFLQHAASYDRIIMNPPFSKLQDQAHIRHAYNLLRSGGLVVAVSTPGWQYRQDAKSRAFKAWTEETGAEVEEMPEGSFSASGTNVRTLLLRIRKP